MPLPSAPADTDRSPGVIDCPDISEPQTLHGLFERQTLRTPDVDAVVFRDRSLTYSELDRRSAQLAAHLVSQGVGLETLVGVCVDRSLEMVVGILAILRAGGAYVPIDPSYPPDRIAQTAADADLSIVLTLSSVRHRLPEMAARLILLDEELPPLARGVPAVLPDVGPNNLAYVIYTSGSTGRPKGVLIEHRSACNNMRWRQQAFGMKPGDRLLQTLSFCFDPSVADFFWTLAAGGTVVMPPPETRGDAPFLARMLDEEKINVVGFGPSFWEVILDEPAIQSCVHLKNCYCGGEQMPASLPGLFAQRLPWANLHNMYGPTETTIDATFWTCRPVGLGEVVPIGRPAANALIYILDEQRQPVDNGVMGELFVSGPGLARGYLNRPELTKERFVANPFDDPRNPKFPLMYRTGDLACRNAAGDIEYRGRVDLQVKLRGFRIELGEVESVLQHSAGVRQAVVDLVGDRLVGYVVAGPPVTASETETSSALLRSSLAKTLPYFMVPSVFVFLDSLPVSPNGKVDRKALPAPDLPGLAASEEGAPLLTDTEVALARIWSAVLKIDVIGRDEDFFALGGHSLLATRVVSRICAEWNVEFPVRALFESPTIAGLARTVEQAVRAPQRQPIDLVSRAEPLRLSFAQQRLWFLDQLSPGSAVYNVPAILSLSGPIEMGTLQRSLQEIVARHEPLRTQYVSVGGEPFQRILPPDQAAISLPSIEVTGDSRDEREADAWRLTTEEARRSFDLTRDLMLRAVLFRIEPNEHWLLLNTHHIASDGWSMGILIHELAAIYGAFSRGLPSPLEPLTVQYADYAAWQRAWLDSGVQATQIEYWKRQLAGAPPDLCLPTDRPRPPTPSFRGARRKISISRQLTGRLQDLGREEGVTLFMVLAAAFQCLLSRYTGQFDILIGSPTAGRTHSDIEDLIGFFVNTLVLRTDLSGDPTSREILQRVRDVALGAYANQDVPFDQLVEKLQPVRDPSRFPFVEALFVLQNTPAIESHTEGLTLRGGGLGENGTTKTDIVLSFWEGEEGLNGFVEYSTDLFDAATIARFCDHYVNIVASFGTDLGIPLSRLPLLDDQERLRIVEGFNATDRSFPRTATVHRLFSEQVRLSPHSPALVWQDNNHAGANRQMTYAELDRASNRLARLLQSKGVRSDTIVGLCLERSPEMIVGTLAILKAGGSYLPLDPSYPEDRLAFLCADTQTPVIVTGGPYRQRLEKIGAELVCIDDRSLQSAPGDETAPETASAHSLAYVMYTSGSTGRPKGVLVEHRNIVRLVKNVQYVDLGPSETILQMAPPSFDAATFEIWGSLLNGGRLAIAPPQPATLVEIGQHIHRFGVTTLWLTSGLFSLMVDERIDDLKPLRQLLAGGDVLSPAAVRKVLHEMPQCRLINGYGPTETTTFACCHTVRSLQEDSPSVPIGRPIANTRAYVLDSNRQPVPIGVVGELYIGGDGVSRGYLNRPELTEERFVVDSFQGEGRRLYRTGDLVRWLAPSSQGIDDSHQAILEFVARADDQVKIRGYRIELGEIESALAMHPDVKETAVVCRNSPRGDKYLVAYYVSGVDRKPSPDEIRAYLHGRLPAYTMPSVFVALNSLPLTSNGKVDRANLPEPHAGSERDRSSVGPRDATEAQLVQIWEELLDARPIGVTDNFFALGGHSLLAVRLLHRIERTFGRRIPLPELFGEPTIENLARVIRENKDNAGSPLIKLNATGSRAPLFFLHGDFMGGFFCSDLARHIGEDQPLFVLPPHGLQGGPLPTIEEMAVEYRRVIETEMPDGPYLLGGFCNGGTVAFEIARQLRSAGKRVDLVAVIDVEAVNTYHKQVLYHFVKRCGWFLSHKRQSDLYLSLQERTMTLAVALMSLWRRIKRGRVAFGNAQPDSEIDTPMALAQDVERRYYPVMARYLLRPYDGAVAVIWSQEGWDNVGNDVMAGWREVAADLKTHVVPGTHLGCLTENGRDLACLLRSCLDETRRD